MLTPDLSAGHWKDEDELAWAVESGRHSAEEAIAFRREGERALALIRRGAFPFDRDWPNWKPNPDWCVPVLPNDWNPFIDSS